MTTLQDILAAVGWQTRVNENFRSVSPAGLRGVDPATTTGLTLGYLGGILDGVSYGNGSIVLGASQTLYVVTKRSDGVVSSSTGTTNWDNTTDYLRMGIAVTGASTITTYTDWRQAYGAAASGMTNPMTTTGDIIYSSSGSTPARLAVGTNGHVLTLAAGVPTWAAATGGFSNPMTTAGDLILGGVAGAAGRLGIGSVGQVLTVSGGTAVWVTPGVGGTVTSVDATGGSESDSGSPITTSGTIRASTLVNAQTGTTYTYLTGDRGKLVTHSNASAIAGTLPQATGTFPAGWFMRVKNKGAGTLTITPTTSTIDGSATLVLTTGQWAVIVSDGTNYQATTYAPSASGLTAFTESLHTAAPNGTVNVARLLANTASATGAIALSPKAGGGVMAQLPDSTTAGGDARGFNTVDWQTIRAAANQVASAIYSGVLSGHSNRASGDYSVAPGGQANLASGQAAMAAGTSSTASGNNSLAIGNTAVASGTSSTAFGQSTTASATNSLAAGQSTIANGTHSLALGDSSTARSIKGAVAHSGGIPSGAGSAGAVQNRQIHLSRLTTDATPVAATATGTAASTTNQIVLPTNGAFFVFAHIAVKRVSSSDIAAYTIKVAGKNIAGTVTLSTPTVVTEFEDAGASGWDVTAVADNTNKAIAIQVTGAASQTLLWSVTAFVTEVEV